MPKACRMFMYWILCVCVVPLFIAQESAAEKRKAIVPGEIKSGIRLTTSSAPPLSTKGRWTAIWTNKGQAFINLETGEVLEFHNDEIEKLQEEIARRLGFRLVDHRMELYGVPLDKEK